MSDPIQQASAALLRGGLKTQQGTLLLYPDRLVHVASSGIGMAFGALGVLVSAAIAKRQAPKRAEEGGKGVTSLPLSGVQSISRAKQGLNKNLLEVTHTDGTFRFGVKYDRWADPIGSAMRANGRTANVNDQGVVFA